MKKNADEKKRKGEKGKEGRGGMGSREKKAEDTCHRVKEASSCRGGRLLFLLLLLLPLMRSLRQELFLHLRWPRPFLLLPSSREMHTGKAAGPGMAMTKKREKRTRNKERKGRKRKTQEGEWG